MTTNSKSGKSKSSKSKSISAKSKDTTGEKSAEKRERVVMEKAAVPTAPTAVTAPVPTETAVAQPAPTVRAAPVVAVEPVKAERTISRTDLEQLVRREAFKRAQLRQFRGGSPTQDWFAAEASVKAQLSARGFSLAN